MTPPWAFQVHSTFNLTGRGTVVVGRVLYGVIDEGDRFEADEPPGGGTVRAMVLARSDDPEAVALLVGDEYAPNVVLSSSSV